MPSNLPTELWHLILSHNPSLSIFLQRGTSRLFAQRHAADMKYFRLAFCVPRIRGQALKCARFSADKRVVYFHPANGDRVMRLNYRLLLNALSRRVHGIVAYAQGDVSLVSRTRNLYEFRRGENEVYAHHCIPLFGLRVKAKKMHVGFEWMPMYAAVLRGDGRHGVD
ncbi:hypothetical protein CC86DRAFT_413134 [Ophiobolus disseminans]|uniref:F-box domain-containing protein n=1 Tax=Ophiobolus disseminans TaxID=1469910 RepID=A0A6A6ZEM2_9PLEO|nr:hypothetical protein CC86DRAFT_413134 [Ophiobolus disseminans]